MRVRLLRCLKLYFRRVLFALFTECGLQVSVKVDVEWDNMRNAGSFKCGLKHACLDRRNTRQEYRTVAPRGIMGVLN